MSAIGRLTWTLGETTRRFFGGRGLLLAGSLAFFFILCLAPLMLLSLSAVGFLLTAEQISEYVLDAGATLLPRYGQEMVGIVSTLLRERRVNGLLGAAVLAVVATELFSLTRTIVNVAFGVRQRRGLLHGFAFDLLALVVVGVVAVAAASAIVTAVALRDMARLVLPPPPESLAVWARTPTLLLIYGSIVALLFLVYRTFPNTTVPTRAAARATVVVVLLWEAARQGVGMYLTRFTPYGTLYGSFGAVVAILVWIYISAALFVWGAYLAAVMTGGLEAEPERPAGDPPTSSPPRGQTRLVYTALGVAGIVVGLFLVQNLTPIRLHLLHWTIEGVPLAAALLLALLVGGLAAALVTGSGRRVP